jgi:hypothetical protein
MDNGNKAKEIKDLKLELEDLNQSNSVIQDLRDKLSFTQNDLKVSKNEISKGKEWIDKLVFNNENANKTNKALMLDVKSA